MEWGGGGGLKMKMKINSTESGLYLHENICAA